MASESDLFERWFRLTDGNNDGKVEGGEAVQFFQRSGLPKEALREIWSQTAGESSSMSKPQFFAALRLVALGQSNGGTFTVQQARAVIVGTAPPLPTPKLQGLTAETWQPGSPSPHQFPPGSAQGAIPAAGDQWPPMSPMDLTRLEQMFLQLDQDCDGILQGGDCFQAFMQMGVDRSVLKTIWSTVAGDIGYLNKDQFVKCVYLIEVAQKGISPPVTLPPEPFPPIAQPTVTPLFARAASLNQQTFPTLPPQATFQSHGAAPYQARGLDLSDTSMSMLAPVERGRLDAERESALGVDKQLYEEENKLATARQKREFYEKSLQDIVLFKRRVGNKLVEVQEQERKAIQEAEDTEKMYQLARVEAEEAALESGALFDRIREAQEKRSEVEALLHTVQKEVAEMEGANPQEVEKIEAEIQSLAEEVAGVEAKKQSLGAQVESYKSQQAALSKQKDDLLLVCAAAEAEVHSAVADIDKIKSQVEEAKSSEDIDQIQKLLRETARVYSNLHSHALKAGIDIPKETRLMLYGRDLMYADDMIGSNIDMEDWNEEGFIIVDAFPDVKDELDKALFDAIMSSNKGTPQSKAGQVSGFDVSFDSFGTPDMGVPFPTSAGANVMSTPNPTNALPDLFAPTTDPPNQQNTAPVFDTMFGSDPFAPSIESSPAPVPTTNQTDPFSAFPSSGKEGQETTGLSGFAVSFDDAPASNNAFGDFGQSAWKPMASNVVDPGAVGVGQSGIIPTNQDPVAAQGTNGGEQENGQGDNPFGDSAFG